MLINLSKPGLSSASEYEKEFYRQNASFTTVTTTGETYVVKIVNWDAVYSKYNIYLQDIVAYDKSYNDNSDLYKSYVSNDAEATEYGLNTKFGNSINLFKKNAQTNKLELVSIDVDPNSNTYGKIIKTPCPE